jgi:hypothetical protein
MPLKFIGANVRKMGCLVALFSASFLVNACQYTHASAAPVSMDGLMKVVHDYGREHHGLLSPGTGIKPDETDSTYTPRISKILEQEDFAQLEKIAQQNRTEKGRLIGGMWKIVGFYDATGMPVFVGEPTDADYAAQIAREKKWIAKYPESVTARLSLADLYLSYASQARGTGFADSVSDTQWDLFHARTAEAKGILLEASALKERDPFWYHAMQLVALNEGWDKAHARELLDQGVAFEPTYYHFYREYARYLMPQWYGQPGDVEAFAAEVSNQVPEPNGSILYFQIVSSLACYCEEAVHQLPQTSYSVLRQGYENLTRLYGTSNRTANRFAFMAVTFRDRASAREAFNAITTMEADVWFTEQMFDGSRDWANAN